MIRDVSNHDGFEKFLLKIAIAKNSREDVYELLLNAHWLFKQLRIKGFEWTEIEEVKMRGAKSIEFFYNAVKHNDFNEHAMPAWKPIKYQLARFGIYGFELISSGKIEEFGHEV